MRHSARIIRFSSRRRRERNFVPLFFSCLIILFLFSALVFVGSVLFIGWVSRDLPDPERALSNNVFAQSSKIYDRTGQVKLYELFSQEKRTLLTLEAIPMHLRYATVVAEDKDFFKHRGFDIRGIFRAFYVNLTRGEILQGGSTITQQLIKNTLLTNEKSFLRKVKELIMAYHLERKYSKDQILKLYLNEIPYGATAYGVESAAQTYFGISARSLTLAQAALLASLPKAPSRLSPYGSNQEELIYRQHYILNLMAAGGYISKDEAEKAKQEKLVFKPKREDIIAPHFVMYVRELLGQKYSEQELMQSGLKITTSLDTNLQKYAEEAIAEWAPRNEKDYQATNASLVALDGENGDILAMVGSRDFFNEKIDGQVNVALRPRQPGSSFKPVVYAAAFMKGYTRETVLFDTETVFKAQPKDYAPKNYDLKEHGPISLAKALAGSLNIPAVKLLYLTGLPQVLNLAESMGYTTLTPPSRFGLSLVLGGGEVKLLEHAAAFRTFASEGIYQPSRAILKIEDQDGQTFFLADQEPGKRVMPPDVARTITSILSQNSLRSYIFGSPSYLELPDRAAAVKTGTTNDYRDAWTLGAVPSLTAGVWVGNSDNHEMKRGADGSKVAAPIWQSFMKKALSGKPVEEFTAPAVFTAEKPILRGEGIGEVSLEIDRASGKRATALTPASFRVKKTYFSLHDILFYVNRDDPAGPLPSSPASDPQYENWEQGVRVWAQKQGIKDNEPPLEEDDIHVPQNFPLVTIKEPLLNAKVSSPLLKVEAEASSPRGKVARVEVYLDDALEGNLAQVPFTFTVNLQNAITGFHTVTVAAFDEVENRGEASVTVNVAK